MKIGLIDVDNFNNLHDCFPNLALMKISAYYKNAGDKVEWYDPLFGGNYDKVFLSKVFNFTNDYPYYINANEIIKGGSGYAIETKDGIEFYNKKNDKNLPENIEHIMPDYSLYFSNLDFDKNGKLTKIGIKHRQTAYGFMSRGCPRGCSFCHVKNKEGIVSVKVANLSEFWNGQKNICLCDPNTLACNEWQNILQQLIDSNAKVNFNQGLDIRMMTNEKAEMINNIKIDAIHFAWDRIQDKNIIIPKFEQFRKISKIRPKDLTVYVLCNFNTTHDQDLYRVEWLKNNGFNPYVMIYNKNELPKGHITRKLQRYVNMKAVFWKLDNFEQYKKEF